MTTFAPPVHRGDFLYSSVLYADLGNGNHHPRASTAEIAALLRPEAPKSHTSGKPSPATPAKDPVWHWYAAQLIHYGLPVTKDKNGAKVRLLTALNQFKLEVPAWILKLEGELKKEWEGENRKLKKAAAGGTKTKAAKTADLAGVGRQTLPSGQGIEVNVNIAIGTGMAVLNQSGATQAGSTGQKGKRKRGVVEPPGDMPTPKKTPSSKKGATASQTLPTRGLSNAVPPTKPQTAAKSATKTPRIKKEPAATSPAPTASRIKQETDSTAAPLPKGRTKQTASKRAAPVQEKTKGESTSSVYPSSPAQHSNATAIIPGRAPRTKQTARKSAVARPGTNRLPPQGPDTIAISGTYDLSIFLERDRMIILRDIARDIWWATLEIGALAFIIKMDPGPTPTTLYQPFPVDWRMRNHNTGELKFGAGCVGEFRLSDDVPGGITGLLKKVPGYGDVDFYGGRMAGPSQTGDLQAEWDGFRKDAYGR